MTSAADTAGARVADAPPPGRDVRRVQHLLRELDALSSAPLAGALAGSSGTAAVQRAREALWAGIKDLDARRIRFQQALDELDDIDLAISYESRFGAATWPERAARLTSRLTEDPAAGSREWLAAWAGAVHLGRYDEAERLLSDSFPLPSRSGFLPDRLVPMLQAMQSALTAADEPEWLAQGLRRCEPVLRYLVDGAELDGAAALGGADRRDAAVLLAQWTAAAGRDAGAARGVADDLGASAADLLVVDALGTADPEERARRAREALAADSGHVAAMAVLAQSPVEGATAHCERVISSLAHLEGWIPYLDALPVPVNAAIWLALARRAGSEHHPDAVAFLDRAESAPSDARTRSATRQLRAELLEAAGSPPAEVAGLLERAATDLIDLDAHQARDLYGRALALVPDHLDAALGWADAVRLVTWTAPIEMARPDIERALGLLGEAHGRHPVDAETAWSLLVESGLRQRLAAGIDPSGSVEAWKALAAVARLLAIDPDRAGAWAGLASVLYDLGAYQSAAAAADVAIAIDPGNEAGRDAAMKSLVNLGDPRAVTMIDALPEGERQAWHLSVLALAVLFEDPVRAHEAAATAVGEQGHDPWTRWVAGLAATLAGQDDEAETHWRWLWREAPRTLDQLYFVAVAALELGYPQDARDLSARVLEGQSTGSDDGLVRAILGMARLLNGDAGGMDDIVLGIRRSPTRRFLDDHRQLTLGRLEVLAQRRGLSIDLERANEALAARHDELRPVTPVEEIVDIADRVAAAAADHGATELATRARTAAKAAAARLLTRDGRSDEAIALLRELCEEEPDVREHRIALDAAEPGTATTTTTTAAATSPDANTQGGAPPDGQEPAADGYRLELIVPQGWFSGVDDPVRDHEIFSRHLPDLRARLGRRGIVVPPVRVQGDDSVDDGYGVTVDGALVVTGFVEPDRLVCRRDWLPSLPADLQQQARPASEADRVSVPVVDGAPSVVPLVTWNAAEVVVRRLEQLVVERDTGSS